VAKTPKLSDGGLLSAALGGEELPEEAAALFTPEVMAAFRARADFWMEGPEGVRDLEVELQKVTLVMMQISSAVATGTIVLPGRSGLNIWARTIRDFPVLAQRVLDILATREEGKK
jgi:alkylhydroperoxidase/carboxymuconolactone decarboxylase family protein YurZ